MSNFRELVKRYESFRDNNVAFKYKKDKEIIEVTYKQFVEDIKKIAEKVLDSNVKRIAVIGNNRYEWVITYLGVTSAGKVIVPLDKALTDKEIEKLLLRSQVDVVVYDEKYQKAVNEAIAQGCNIKYRICMDNIEEDGVLKFSKILEDGENIIKSGNSKYDDVKLKEDEMYVMLFTSGTTNEPKAVMLSQENICKNFSQPLILNIGGGFGVKYVDEDKPIPFDVVSKTLIDECEKSLEKNNIQIEKLCIEPGRSIVAEAGYTLYTIGGIKKTPNKLYYFIDGGMTDNIRPALYQAKYNADIIGKEDMLKSQIVTVAGKCCESGDIIIENIPLPKTIKGDLLITYTTGAYGYSMSSNYNKALTPAVVFVNDGKDKLVCRRQTIDELLEREL